ncbi:MAG: PIN domain-containing protein [Bacteroidales bacterium]|nr:PIN domain-containing protein [Bacteroidales bacterium]MBR1488023.1 PIN domain-containing protein [Bacteroidales bacterium]
MDRLPFKVFLDTNVLLDVLCAPRRPASEASLTIFQAIRSGLFEGMLTVQSIVDASYILSREEPSGPEAFKRRILSMLNYINVESVSAFDVRDAIRHGGPDFEDAVQFACADAAGCDAIITSDRKFRHQREGSESGILFFSPEAFVARMTADPSPE